MFARPEQEVVSEKFRFLLLEWYSKVFSFPGFVKKCMLNNSIKRGVFSKVIVFDFFFGKFGGGGDLKKL